MISSDDNNLMNAQAALLISSQEVDNSAECSARHSITSALALTMNTPLSIVTKSSMSSAVAACADGLHAQSKVHIAGGGGGGGGGGSGASRTVIII